MNSNTFEKYLIIKTNNFINSNSADEEDKKIIRALINNSVTSMLENKEFKDRVTIAKANRKIVNLKQQLKIKDDEIKSLKRKQLTQGSSSESTSKKEKPLQYFNDDEDKEFEMSFSENFSDDIVNISQTSTILILKNEEEEEAKSAAAKEEAKKNAAKDEVDNIVETKTA